MNKNINYSDLADTDIVQVIDFDDYFGEWGPHAKNPMTKQLPLIGNSSN